MTPTTNQVSQHAIELSIERLANVTSAQELLATIAAYHDKSDWQDCYNLTLDLLKRYRDLTLINQDMAQSL